MWSCTRVSRRALVASTGPNVATVWHSHAWSIWAVSEHRHPCKCQQAGLPCVGKQLQRGGAHSQHKPMQSPSGWHVRHGRAGPANPNRHARHDNGELNAPAQRSKPAEYQLCNEIVRNCNILLAACQSPQSAQRSPESAPDLKRVPRSQTKSPNVLPKSRFWYPEVKPHSKIEH
jgi:hypothetical protein